MSRFKIITHEILYQHVLQCQPAVANEQEDISYLEVQQYIPLDNPCHQLGDVAIFAAHANGIPNESYQSLWTDLLDEFQSSRVSHSSNLGRRPISTSPNQTIPPRQRPASSDSQRSSAKELLKPSVSIGHGVQGSQVVGARGVGALREGGVKRGAAPDRQRCSRVDRY